MKALVLSGGSGTRLRPFSYSMPKQLIPVGQKPVIAHVIENIRDLGVTEVAVIVGDWKSEIERLLGDGSRFGVRVTYIQQEKPLGLAHCVRLASEFLGEEDFVMYLGDNMLLGGLEPIAEEFAKQRPAAQLVVRQVADPRSFGVVELAADGSVHRLVEKPENPRSNLAVIGVYFFTSAIHEAVAAIGPSARGELEITDAVQWLVGQGAEVRASEYEGYWRDTGSVDDVLDCNRALLDRTGTEIRGSVDQMSWLFGPVVIESGARIVRSRIQGPAVIGAGSVIEDSHIGPYTAIGDGCALRYTHIDDSIVLTGARVSHVRGLHGSLIGRSAAVGQVERGAGHHRLVVGDHTRVEVLV
ncbi:glucose-1-phosphate thymidylyltransferase [Streptomyces iconiensis]|uniref:Glucose-1-phosphate thymidylyltransferase n=1 Tax=Streptomyces iconiensis TaxID=1384038 RepID=A0ABT7A103_9ACTN|nr:glucose-1-phosphate thymidylyltransferase [Streptomyces iconiensis]MDJ1134995.1 glucose-1-phosphate thymidylyltransferase [Streptomyces iconiensis]